MNLYSTSTGLIVRNLSTKECIINGRKQKTLRECCKERRREYCMLQPKTCQRAGNQVLRFISVARRSIPRCPPLTRPCYHPPLCAVSGKIDSPVKCHVLNNTAIYTTPTNPLFCKSGYFVFMTRSRFTHKCMLTILPATSEEVRFKTYPPDVIPR